MLSIIRRAATIALGILLAVALHDLYQRAESRVRERFPSKERQEALAQDAAERAEREAAVAVAEAIANG